MNKFLPEVLRYNIKTCIAYSGIKLIGRFQLRRQTKKHHQHNAVD